MKATRAIQGFLSRRSGATSPSQVCPYLASHGVGEEHSSVAAARALAWLCVVMVAAAGLGGCSHGESTGSRLYADGYDVGWYKRGADSGWMEAEQVLVVRLVDAKKGVSVYSGGGAISFLQQGRMVKALRGQIVISDERCELPTVTLRVTQALRARFLQMCHEQRAVVPALRMLVQETDNDELRQYTEHPRPPHAGRPQ